MSKFKVGDVVKCVEPFHTYGNGSIDVGGTATIVEYYEAGEYAYHFRVDKLGIWWCRPESFELALPFWLTLREVDNADV